MLNKLIKKKRKLVGVLSFIICMTIAFASNTEKALAFGGDIIITDANGSNYTKEMHCQIKPSNNSNGDLIIEGYAFVNYAQQYLSKGTGVNDTHSYRLKIQNTNFVYNDVLVGGDDYTIIAEDSTYSTLGTSSTYYCNSGQNYNTRLQQVSFKFIIPASDIASLGPYKDYYKLELECTLKNIKFASTGGTKHTKVINVTKLADADFLNGSTISRNYQTTDSKKRVTVSTSGINYVRVNAVTVRLRDSNGKKTTGYNGGYFVRPLSSLTTSELTNQKNILYEIAKGTSSVNSSFLGEVMYPLKCTYNKTDSYSTSISLDELFKQRPDLKEKYEEYKRDRLGLHSKIAIALGVTPKAKDCNTHKFLFRDGQASSSVRNDTCRYCLKAKGYYEDVEKLELLNKKMVEIEAMCIGYNKGSTTTTVNATYYCKSIYLEAAQGVDYYVSINVEELASRYYIETQTIKENTNSTTMGAAQKVSSDSVMGAVTGFNYNYNSKNAGVNIPKGYHTTVITESLTNSSSKNPNLPYSKILSFTPSNMPYSKTVYVKVEFRNDAPAIKPKSKK